MVEEWKWVKGFEGVYQVSNLGRLKSFKNILKVIFFLKRTKREDT